MVKTGYTSCIEAINSGSKLIHAMSVDDDGVLMYALPSGVRVMVIPRDDEMRRMVMEDAHVTQGGVGQTLDKVSKRYWWKGMWEDEPVHTISLNFTPMPWSTAGHTQLLTAIDHDTRYTWVAATAGETSKGIVDFLEKKFTWGVGNPHVVISDRGKAFEVERTRDFLRGVGAELRMMSGMHPQTNGMSERWNRTVQDQVRAMAMQGADDWERSARAVCFAYNTMTHPATGYTLHFLMYGREARNSLAGSLHPMHSDSLTMDEMVRKHDNTLHEARKRKIVIEATYRVAMTGAYDKKHGATDYKVGDTMWKTSNTTLRHLKVHDTDHKLVAWWDGPFIVAEERGSTVRLQKPGETMSGKWISTRKISSAIDYASGTVYVLAYMPAYESA
eukprot:m51a1_g11683 hypothetical protein (388) ;mRNA; r:546-4971